MEIRSELSYRRQGSSAGIIWEDRYFSGDLNLMKQRQEGKKGDLRKCQSDGSSGMVTSSSSNGGPPKRSRVVSTASDPPSPKLSGCWCVAFSAKPKSE
ncbi:unnamed protein product [Ilex paraguariensis]|uniref:Uncharacterized protein n=1 Tax=Ilex paraguariensis TaxID=185542 RepID=A0ABC8SEW1_9AQUA